MMRTLQVLPAVVLAAALGIALPAAADPPAPPASSSLATMSAPEAVAASPRLAARIQPFLPENVDIQDAADGFDDIVTFLATVHVAHNQQLPFKQLKTRMTAGGSAPTLVQAIQDVAPSLPVPLAQEAVQMAQHQAQIDVGAAVQTHTLLR
jgi:hypothetical protein